MTRLIHSLCLIALASLTAGAQVLTSVSITAIDSIATEPLVSTNPFITLPPGLSVFTNGAFRVSRTGSTAAALTVNFSVGGTATPGTDYTALPSSVVIPAGKSEAFLTVATLTDNTPERDETVTLTLQSGTGYLVPLKVQPDVVTIVDRDQTVRFTSTGGSASEPGVDTGTMLIERLGTLRGALWVRLVFGGSATNGADVVTIPDSVLIPDGQASLTLTITPKADGAAEGSETLNLRSSNIKTTPTGGATVTIIDAVATIAPSIPSLTEAQGNSASFVVTRTGDLSQSVTLGLTVGGTATRGVDYVNIPNTITIPAQSASASVPIVVNADALTEGGETIVLTLGGTATTGAGTPNSATMVINDNIPPVVATVTLSPTSVMGGTATTATIALNGPAPVGGLIVQLSSSNAAATLSAASLVIPAGQSTGSASIATVAVSSNTTSTIAASTSGGVTISQTLTIQTPLISTFSLSRTTVTPAATSDSTSVIGTVTMTGPAPSNGLAVTLGGSTAPVTVPATVNVPAGQTSATFRVTVVPVAAQASVTISASRLGTSQSRTLQVNPPRLTSASFAQSSITGRSPASPPQATVPLTFTLDGPAPSSGGTLTTTTSVTQLTLNPTTLFISPGSSSGTLTANAGRVDAVTSATATLSFLGSSTTAALTILPGVPASVTVSPNTIAAGQGGTADIQMTGNAPSTGLTVPVSFSLPVARQCNNATTTTIPANFLSHSVNICTQAVTASTAVTVTIGQGTSAVSTSFSVAPPVAAQSVVLTATEVPGGSINNISGTVTLASAAPAGGTTVFLSSSHTSVIRFRATSNGTESSSLNLQVPAGASSAGFFVRTSTVSQDTPATITVAPGTNVQTSLLVRAPVLTAINISPLTVAAGASASGTVVVSAPAPSAGFAVQLSSSSTVATVPSVVTIFGGNTSANFTINTQATAVDVPATITASLNGVQQTRTLTVAGPVTVSALSFSPTSVLAGLPATGTVTLSGAAPAQGTVVNLSTTSSLIGIPSTVTVPSGATSATFQATTQVFGAQANQSVTVTAALGTGTRNASLTLQPIQIAQFNFSSSTGTGGSTVTGVISLNRAAPDTGLTLTLTSSSAAVAVPPTVLVAPGQQSVQFTATTSPVATNTAASVQAVFQGASRAATVTVTPPNPQSVAPTSTLPPGGVLGGNSLNLTVTINAPAPAGGLILGLTASPAGVATVPATVTIPAGQTSATFDATTVPVGTNTTVTINASRPGGGFVNGTFTVRAPQATTLTLSPTSVTGGQPSTATLTLEGPAPSGYAFNVTRTGCLGATVPPNVTFTAGQNTVTFQVTTTVVTSNQSCSIAANGTGGNRSAILSIVP